MRQKSPPFPAESWNHSLFPGGSEVVCGMPNTTCCLMSMSFYIFCSLCSKLCAMAGMVAHTCNPNDSGG